MNRAEAEAAGYTVDNYVYPWFAYKGPRFAPTESKRIETDLESERLAEIVRLRRALLSQEEKTQGAINALRPFAEIEPPLAAAMVAGMALRATEYGDEESKNDFNAIKKLADGFPKARTAVYVAERS